MAVTTENILLTEQNTTSFSEKSEEKKVEAEDSKVEQFSPLRYLNNRWRKFSGKFALQALTLLLATFSLILSIVALHRSNSASVRLEIGIETSQMRAQAYSMDRTKLALVAVAQLNQSVALLQESLAHLDGMHAVTSTGLRELSEAIDAVRVRLAATQVQVNNLNMSQVQSFAVVNQSLVELHRSVEQNIDQVNSTFYESQKSTNGTLVELATSLKQLVTFNQSVSTIRDDLFQLNQSMRQSVSRLHGFRNQSVEQQLSTDVRIATLVALVTQLNQSLGSVEEQLNATAGFLTGTIVPYSSGNQEPSLPWLLCNGQAVSRQRFHRLFQVIGETYGAGDGQESFNLPDLRGRFLVGLDDGQVRLENVTSIGATGGKAKHRLTTSELPAHSHGSQTLTVQRSGSHSHGVSDQGHDHGGSTTDFPSTLQRLNGRGYSLANQNSYSYYFNDQAASHSHSIPHGYTGISIQTGGEHTHSLSGNTEITGGNQEFNLLPPFQAVQFVIFAD